MPEWAVETKVGRAGVAELLAVVTDVPAGTKRGDVEAALEGWQRWPAWQARFTIGTVVKVRRLTAEQYQEAGYCDVIAWGDLAPSRKRVSIEFAGELHTALAREARAQDRPIAQCVIEAVTRWLPS